MWTLPYLDAMLVGPPPHCVYVGGFDITDAAKPAAAAEGALTAWQNLISTWRGG